ncbi:MAG: SEC-C domain-containing protein [Armatimonadetes bacterium]|nr:SEC-C domain-containing protein [Armatimonadota bacterium]
MTTPGEVSPLVLQFCRRIEPDAEPLYVPVAPLGGVPTNFCNLVVTAKVARDGGEALSGWTIWLNPDVMIEAEAHMVWRSPTGDLIDVTPKPDGETRILFLPASQPHSFARNIPNRRQALVDSIETRATVRTYALYDQLRDRYWRGAAGAVIPANELQQVQDMQDALMRGDTPDNWFCPCRSGKKFGKCCGRPEGTVAPYTNF